MARLLEKMNERYEKSLRNSAINLPRVSTPTDGDIFENYSNALQTKEVVEVTFDMADPEGNLKTFDENGICVFLDAEKFHKTNGYYEASMKERFLGNTLRVRVTSIDEEKKTVYVESATGKNDIKGGIIKEILKELDAGNHPVLWGDVISVSESRCTVNILHSNILGFIDIRDWSPTFTRNLETEVAAGQSVQFEVVKQLKKRPGKDRAFELSRKNVIPDPWTEIVPLEKGAAITVRCVDKPVGKNYFWGVSDRAPGVEIMCLNNARLKVLIGATFACEVKDFSPSKRTFIVRPMALYPKGNYTEENIRFVTTKGLKK